MSFSHTTPNYGLPQYGENDKPSILVDMNDAYLIIDQAMGDNSSTLTSLQNQVDAVDNRMDAVETEFQNTQQLANTALQQSTEAKAIAVSAQNAANLAEHHAELAKNAAEQAAQNAQQAANSVAGLRDQVDQNTANIATLQNKVNTNTQNISNLQTKTENIRQEVTVINQFISRVSTYKTKRYDRPNIPLWDGYEEYLYPTSTAGWEIDLSWNPDLKTLIINSTGNRVIRAEWEGNVITNPMPENTQNVLIPGSALLSYRGKATVPLVRLPFMVSPEDFGKEINAGTISFQIGKTINVQLPGDVSNQAVEVPFQSFTNKIIVAPGGDSGADGNKWLWLMMMTTGVSSNNPAWLVRSPAIGDGRTVNLSFFKTLIDYFDN